MTIQGGIFALSAKRNKSLKGGEHFAFEKKHSTVIVGNYTCTLCMNVRLYHTEHEELHNHASC